MIGYVLGRFPELSTTFVLNELLELEVQGVPLHVFSLRRSLDPLAHEEFARLRAPVSYLPGPTGLGSLLQQHWRLRRQAPTAYRGSLASPATRQPPRWRWRFLQAGYVARQARALGLVHLHAHFANHPATVALLASRLSGIPFSFTAHAVDLFKHDVDRELLARKLEAATFVATVSEFTVDFLRELAPGAADRIVLVRNGIDLERFAPASPGPGPFRILCVARLVEKKGIPVLIEACYRLRQRGLDFRCDIVGQGPLRRHLEAQIRDQGLRDRVRLQGPAAPAGVLRHYHAARAYVLPCLVARDGDRDGLPVSLVEALACGLPAVSSSVTGVPEVLRNEQNGLLVAPGDPQALADAVARLITDGALYGRLAAGARQSVVTHFDRRRTVTSLRGLLLRRNG